MRERADGKRCSGASGAHHLPSPPTKFVGRRAETAELSRIVLDNRVVTLTGSAGAGKTRLAIEAAAQVAGHFPGGVWYVDLAPITNPLVVATMVARALGLPDQPDRGALEILLTFAENRRILLLLDNCDHLHDACGQMVVKLLERCQGLTALCTSREPAGFANEVIWRVRPLRLADEAIELFTDRARRARPDFIVGDDNAALVIELCRRLDGMPLAIELAAARVGSLPLSQIVASLKEQFRLLTGNALTAVSRQQTVTASLDWSHSLLTEPERVLFRRLAVFMRGFDLDAAEAVGSRAEMERYQLRDQLTRLVENVLVVASWGQGAMRYGLLETVRQYALEKLGESGEADAVRTRHRDYYTSTAASLEPTTQTDEERLRVWADVEIGNLGAAYSWSRENFDDEAASRLASSLHQLPEWANRRGDDAYAWTLP